MSEDGLAIVTARGGMRLTPIDDIRPVAYELPGRHPDTWQHGLALCLPEDNCQLAGRWALTELGPDVEGLRPEDRGAILFDLGLAISHADICVRTDDPKTIELLRGAIGRFLLTPEGLPLLREIAALSPHRVFRCHVGRIEVYQPIPSPKDKSPDGPHTHVLPKLLALRRTHAATLPIPAGWVPCMTLFPPNPISDGHGGAKPFNRHWHVTFKSFGSSMAPLSLSSLKRARSACIQRRRSRVSNCRLPSIVRAAQRLRSRCGNGSNSKMAVRTLRESCPSLPTNSSARGGTRTNRAGRECPKRYEIHYFLGLAITRRYRFRRNQNWPP